MRPTRLLLTSGPRPTNIALALLTLAIATVPANAQTLEIGGRAGPAITTHAGDGDADSKLGFSVAGFAGFKLGERVTIYGELSFVRKGSTNEWAFFFVDPSENLVETSFDSSVDLDYLELQVPVAFLFPTGGKLRPRLYAAPSLAVELGCRASLAVRTEVFSPGGVFIESQESKFTGDCRDDYEHGVFGGPLFTETKTLDIGIVFGGGLDLRIGGGALTADLRYNLGLSDIADSDATLRNRAFQVLLGYSYFPR
ncbi:MAG: PorT family protein [Gemmatimonadota bacterium]|nr:MAG: PorT family protein [Gemmatimonadota bacterium]